MTRYIESTPLPDGTYDHTDVREAYDGRYKIETWESWSGRWEKVKEPQFFDQYQYRAQVPDTYGIHRSSSTLHEAKGDAGPAVAEMLLDRIKELESALLIAQKFCNSCTAEECPDEVAIPINLAIDKDYYK